MTKRDIGAAWEFLKLSFRDVNQETVEYQRPRSRRRFEEVFEEEGIEQLLFEVDGDIVAYAECSYEVTGSDSWINPRYFEKRNMNPLFVDELAVHPEWHGKGVGSFVLEQLHHLARLVGGVLDAGRQPGAAVIAAQQRLGTEPVDVAPDGLRRDREMLRHGIDRDEAALMHEGEDLLLSVGFGHSGTLSVAPAKDTTRGEAAESHS